MLASEIINAARHILSDTNKTRWTDARLLSLLNEALADVAKTTILLMETTFVALINGQVNYDLSELALKIVRIDYESKELPAMSHSDLDNRDLDWQTVAGPKALAWVYDIQKEANFKIYPVLEQSNVSNIDFGGSYGIITGVTYSDLELEIEEVFGDLGEVAEDGFIKVYYTQKHPTIELIEDEVNISDIAKEPISHFIAGRALRDNQDAQNRAFGNEELSLYNAQIDAYSLEKSKNFNRVEHSTTYNPLGT